MNLHEYQAKALFAEYGLPVSKGQAVDTPEQAAAAAADIGGDRWVVKLRYTRRKGKSRRCQTGKFRRGGGGVRGAMAWQETGDLSNRRRRSAGQQNSC